MHRSFRMGVGRWLLWGTVTLLVIVYGILSVAALQAHGGGVPRLTGEIAGPYRIFAWTQPEPLRVGEMHLSIGVVKAATGNPQSATALDEAVTDATVLIHLSPATADVAEDAPVLSISAVLQEQLGSYYYEADATLPIPGDWRFTIEVSSALGAGQAEFMGSVAAAREINWRLIGAAAVLLFCLLGLIGLWNRMQAKETMK